MQNSQYANVDQIRLQAISKLKKVGFFAEANGLASLQITDGSTWQWHTVDPLRHWDVKAIIV